MSSGQPRHRDRGAWLDERPYTVLSCSMTLDGYLDDATQNRLLLSNDDDFDRVDCERAASDAILVGATTIRRDDPRLLVRSASRRHQRLARGLTSTPAKVTLTSTGCLDPAARFFTTGDGERIVYCASGCAQTTRTVLNTVATVLDAGPNPSLGDVLSDLGRRGIRRLLVEGGGTVLTQLLVDDLADELQLVVAPLFVGDRRAARFVGDGDFPWRPPHRATLVDVTRIGDVALLRYALSPRFDPATQGPHA